MKDSNVSQFTAVVLTANQQKPGCQPEICDQWERIPKRLKPGHRDSCPNGAQRIMPTDPIPLPLSPRVKRRIFLRDGVPPALYLRMLHSLLDTLDLFMAKRILDA